MPPHSTSLLQEGAAFKSFLLVENQQFREKEIVEALTTPTKAKGAVGTRNLADNLSDLKAQVAANQKGIQLVGELIDSYGLDVVQAYMNYIQSNAEVAVRDMLKEIARQTKERTGKTSLQAEERMDDGSPIRLTVTIDENGSALCDFTGSGHQVWGNCNAPRAITLSALIYCLRCMVGHDVPLNQVLIFKTCDEWHFTYFYSNFRVVWLLLRLSFRKIRYLILQTMQLLLVAMFLHHKELST